MYVAVKGGEHAIDNAHALLAASRRGEPSVPALSVAQIRQQMPLAVARVMSEGSLFDKELAALAIKQAAGDLPEAIFLLRAYRTTLPRFLASIPLDTATMRIGRRISATFKDLPGGQMLGPTFDYTHRLLDFSLLDESGEAQNGELPAAVPARPLTSSNDTDTLDTVPRVADMLAAEGLLGTEQHSHATVPDITRDPLDFPASRAQRLQALARGDEGFLLALAYSTQRGYGRNHPFAGEIRIGTVEVWVEPEELDFAVPIGDIEVTECEMINQFVGSHTQLPQFTRGYGLAFGHAERKAMAMSLVDRALRAQEYQEEVTSPAQQEEFVLMHCDNVEAAGFVAHLKLPHYVDFQSELDLIRKLRRQHPMNGENRRVKVKTAESGAEGDHSYLEKSA
ncbi:carbon-phosphorus lyase complex subunit PhnI [Allopusillimonas soli]|uniref:Carbon-phosphorus lyase complex subunit PhnI n=1 Tax=Allopusillimonas soli TaxID=659016 RepID=A0A853F9R7_9BURK|nr:carbon-phosphorus lyase complex subunit PhnI [Allopusillimonas soli]NYT37435.1 carbon-phosphorus lyase complex subunit PhnI [Allopusillimonas soli]TEA74583.1 carbon-phosphorus lyase complex subunit PhnI [Allopusillimonas soli]